MSESDVVIVFQLGNSYPQDQIIEDEILRRLPLSHVRYRQILASYSRCIPFRCIATRLRTLRRVLAALGDRPVILVGRSSGARVITKLAAEGLPQIRGVVCIGYPFRPPGSKLDPDRIDHLRLLETPTLIFQGRDDEYGGISAPSDYALSPNIEFVSFPGRHDFPPEAFPWDDLTRRMMDMASCERQTTFDAPPRQPLRPGPAKLADPAWWTDQRAIAVATVRWLMRAVRRPGR